MFDEAQRALQQKYDTSRIADRIREKFLTGVIAPDDKAFIERVERSRYVPPVGKTTPVPDWKKDDWAQGYLPAGDPATNSP